VAAQANKAKQVREALGLTPTEAGKLLFDFEGKKAYDMWSRWERTGKWDASTDNYFTFISMLFLFKEWKTAGASKAFDLILKQLAEERKNESV